MLKAFFSSTNDNDEIMALQSNKDETANEGTRSVNFHSRFSVNKQKCINFISNMSGKIRQKVALILIALSIWGALYAQSAKLATFQNPFIKIMAMAICGKLVGVTLQFIRLPPMLGMLAVGMIMRSFGIIIPDYYNTFISILRRCVLIGILILGGLSLEKKSISEVAQAITNLAIIGSIFEVFIVLILSHHILDVPWLWSFHNGLVNTANAPSIVIQYLYILNERGFYVRPSVSTLIIAATILNNVVAIALLDMNSNFLFSPNEIAKPLITGPVSIVTGAAFGFLWGFMCRYFPAANDEFVVALRSLMIGVGSVFATLVGFATKFSVSGMVATVLIAFISVTKYLKEWTPGYNPIQKVYFVLWQFLQPFLFTLIGFELDLTKLEGIYVFDSFIIIFFGIMVRTIATYIALIFTNFTQSEIILVTLFWLPKATVQATYSAQPYLYAVQYNVTTEIEYGLKFLMLTDLTILLAAPTGIILIDLFVKYYYQFHQPENTTLIQ